MNLIDNKQKKDNNQENEQDNNQKKEQEEKINIKSNIDKLKYILKKIDDI